MRFNPPPNWPVGPGWAPDPGWTPDPSWPPAPPGWQFWIDDSAPSQATVPQTPAYQGSPTPGYAGSPGYPGYPGSPMPWPGGQVPGPARPPSHTTRNVLIGVGVGAAVVIALVIALVVAFGGSKPKSDEDQIRAALTSLEKSWNDNDYDGFVSHACKKIKTESGNTESSFKDQRNETGTISFKVTSIKVDGDNAKVDVTETFSKQKTDTETLDFHKEDGEWKLC